MDDTTKALTEQTREDIAFLRGAIGGTVGRTAAAIARVCVEVERLAALAAYPAGENGKTTCANCGAVDFYVCGCYDRCRCGHDRRSHMASGVCTHVGCDCTHGLHGKGPAVEDAAPLSDAPLDQHLDVYGEYVLNGDDITAKQQPHTAYTRIGLLSAVLTKLAQSPTYQAVIGPVGFKPDVAPRPASGEAPADLVAEYQAALASYTDGRNDLVQCDERVSKAHEALLAVEAATLGPHDVPHLNRRPLGGEWGGRPRHPTTVSGRPVQQRDGSRVDSHRNPQEGRHALGERRHGMSEPTRDDREQRLARIAQLLTEPHGALVIRQADAQAVAALTAQLEAAQRERDTERATAAALREALANALSLSKVATNTWACVARSKRDHDVIAGLHRDVDALRARAALLTPPTGADTGA